MSLRFFDVGPGGPAEVFWHQSRIFLPHAVVSEASAFVQVYVYEATGARVAGAIWPASRGAWPCGRSALGEWWLLYRDEDERATLRRDGQVVWRSPVPCGGNHCVALGSLGGRDVLAWQRAGDNALFVILLETLATAPDVTPSTEPGTQVGIGAADGISHLSDLDGLVLWKDNFGAVPGMTAPSRAGLLVAGEHPDAGVLVQYYDRQLLVWPAATTYTPRLAVDRGTYAVTTWNKAGVLLATFTVDDLVVPAPPAEPDAPFPPGKGWTRRDDITEIDLVDYLLGTEWSRNGMHVPADTVTYSHPFQARSGSGWVQHTKFAPPDTRAATWTFDAQWLGLAFDGTNELAKGYRFVVPGTDNTAAIYPRRMRVGQAHARTTPVEILDLATNTRRRVMFTGYVAAVYDGPKVGDLPPTTHAVIVFDPANDDSRGWREMNIGAKGLGCWYWHQVRKADGAVPDMRWVGTTNAPRVVDPTPFYADALPVASVSTPPPPTPQPEPPVKIWAYNDADAVRVIDFLELKYVTPTEQGGLGRTEVDKLGIARWNHDAIRLLDGGRSVDATLKEINRRINQIVGLPLDAWPGVATDPVPDQPVPSSSRLVGPLRIAADKSAYIDDTGPVLPVLCHLGDGLSRWTRDPGGVSTLLDDIAAAGYDGVRTWTVLGGSSYWNGREVGPMYQGNYFDHVSAFADALRARGLRWLVSQGDAMRLLPTTPERQGFMRALAERLDLELVAGVDVGNELLWNGEDDPAKMRAAVDAFRAVLPCAVWSLTSPGSEEKADLDTFSGSVFDVHGYRDNRSWDKVRHIFSIGYEGKPSARLGIQSEPFGYGDLVSASANKDELTTGVMQLACAVSLLSRQAWVYFSGPGVKSDAGQRLQDMPGFRETCAMRDALPRDLMTFQTLVHGGASQKGRRVFAVPRTDGTRCDHALHADGRFVCAVYGESWRQAYQDRTCQIEKRIDCGEAGYVIVGRV